jgi:FkbM family methyltransferase
MIIYTLLFTPKGENPADNKYIKMYEIWLTFLYKNNPHAPFRVFILIDKDTFDIINSDQFLKDLHISLGANVQYLIIDRPENKHLGILEKYRVGVTSETETEPILYLDLDCVTIQSIEKLLPTNANDIIICLKDKTDVLYSSWFYIIPGKNSSSFFSNVISRGRHFSSPNIFKMCVTEQIKIPQQSTLFFTPPSFINIDELETSPNKFFVHCTGPNSYTTLVKVLLVEYRFAYARKNLLPSLYFFDEKNKVLNNWTSEFTEQFQATKFVEPDAKVLELGARYGTVSCVVNKKLRYPEQQVVVEPDPCVWESLEKNRERNNCKFKILKGVVSRKPLVLSKESNGYGTNTVEATEEESSIHSKTLEDIESEEGYMFDTLLADCEGFLEQFFDENPKLYKQLHTVLFEKDNTQICNYDKIKECLKSAGFECLEEGFHEVWKKPFSLWGQGQGQGQGRGPLPEA